MMKNIFLFTAISMCFAFSCNNSKKIAVNDTIATTGSGSEILYQYQWNLTELGGVPVPAVTKAHLLFTAGQPNKVSGNTGCNLLNGSFELMEKDGIKFSAFATTRRACADQPINDLERKFLDALGLTSSWSIKNNQLILSNGNTILAKLNGIKSLAAEEAILNGNWELRYISEPKISFDGLFPNKKPTLTFKLPSPNISGNGGCNGYGGEVKIEGHNISFSKMMHTMMACDGINGENQFFNSMQTVTAYSVNADTSLILMKGDIAVMRFVKK